jgi:hypothetical protein
MTQEFTFKLTTEAADKIFCVLKKYGLDLGRAIDAQKCCTELWLRVQATAHPEAPFQEPPTLATYGTTAPQLVAVAARRNQRR